MSSIKEIIKKGLVVSDDITDKLIVQHLRNGEFRKYKSPKRKAIYETIILTDEQKKEIDLLYKTYYGEKSHILGIATLQHLQGSLIRIIFLNYYLFQNLSIL